MEENKVNENQQNVKDKPAQDVGGGGQGQKDNNLSDFDKFLQQDGMQAEFDRRIAKSLETQKKNLANQMQQQINDAVNNAVKEAQERAKMTAEQQAQYDAQKRADELAKREAAIAKRELKATAKEKLQDKGLSCDLAEFLDYTDEDHMVQSLEKLAKTYQQSIQVGVEAKLKGSKPLEKANQTTEAEIEQQIAAIMSQQFGY